MIKSIEIKRFLRIWKIQKKPGENPEKIREKSGKNPETG